MTQLRMLIGNVTAAQTPRIWRRVYCGISGRSIGVSKTRSEVGGDVVLVMACVSFQRDVSFVSGFGGERGSAGRGLDVGDGQRPDRGRLVTAVTKPSGLAVATAESGWSSTPRKVRGPGSG